MNESVNDARGGGAPTSRARRPAASRWRLVPLVILVVLSAAAALLGLIWQANPALFGVAVQAPTPEPSTAPEPSPTSRADACTPAFAEPATDPWEGEARDRSEAKWQEKAESIAGYAVDGNDGFVFFGEIHHSNLSQAVGRTTLTPEQVAAWDDYLGETKDALAADGRQFYVLVSPAKWQIVPEALPGWMQELRGPGDFSELQRQLPDVPWVDARSAMARTQVETPLYSPLNSHWSKMGATTAFGQLVSCFRATDAELADTPLPAIDGVTMVEDDNEFAVAGIERQPGNDVAVPVLSTQAAAMSIESSLGTEEDTTMRELQMHELPATTKTPDAPMPQTVLVVRDSTGNAIAPMFQSTFRSTRQIRHSLEDPGGMPDIAAEADRAGADIVVLVFAQRYLQLVPGEPVP